VALERDDVALMSSGPNDHVDDKGPSLTGSLYFRVTEVDELWNRVRERVSLLSYSDLLLRYARIRNLRQAGPIVT
jgi:hypothetical protein